MMFKKVLLATILMTSTIGVAVASPAPYVGASVGVAVNSSNHGITNQPGYFRGVPVSAFAGYGGPVDQNFYLAGEIGGTAGTGEFTNKNGLKTTYGYSISL